MEEGGTTVHITNIPKGVSQFYLCLYLEKIFERDVDVEHAESRSAAEAVVKGATLTDDDIEKAKVEIMKSPLSGEMISVSLRKVPEAEPKSSYTLPPPTPTTPETEQSLWNLSWTSASSTTLNEPPDAAGESSPMAKDDQSPEKPTLASYSQSSGDAFESLTSFTFRETSTKETTSYDVSNSCARTPESTPTSTDTKSSDGKSEEEVKDGSIQPKKTESYEMLPPGKEDGVEKHTETPATPNDSRLEEKADQGNKDNEPQEPDKSEGSADCLDAISVVPEKWKLVECRLRKVSEEDHSLKIRYDRSSHTVSVGGVEAKLKVFELMASIDEVPIPGMSTELASLLQTEEGEKALDDKNIEGTLVVREGVVYMTVDSALEEISISKLKELVKEEEHQTLGVHDTFLQSKSWENFSGELSQKFLVIVKVDKAQRKITLTGIYVQAAGKELESKLEENATTTESLEVSPGKGRYMSVHEQPFVKLLEKNNDASVAIKEGDKWLFEVSGHVNAIANVKKQLQGRIDSVQHEIKEINRPGTRVFFTSSHGKSMLQGWEVSYRCVIDVEDGKDQRPLDLGTASSTKGDGFLSSFSNYIQGAVKNIFSSNVGDGAPVPRREESSSGEESDKPSAAAPATTITKNADGEYPVMSEGNVSLLLFRGDITKYKADALVNTPVADTKTFAKAGALAKAFQKVGGQELEQKYYEAATDEKKSVISTPAFGELKNTCSMVFHIKLRSWREPSDKGRGTERKLQCFLRDCLKMCEEHKLTSIAFPTIGCGQLRYPVRKVASCFQKALKEFSSGGHSLKVTLVAYDQNTCDEMLDYFAPKAETDSDSEDLSEDDFDSLGEGSEEYTAAADSLMESPRAEELKSYVLVDEDANAAAANTTQSSPSAWAGLIFNVYAGDKQLADRTLSAIEGSLDNALVEDKIEHPELPYAEETLLQRVMSLNSESVAVTIDSEKRVNLSGISSAVLKCRKEVIYLLDVGATDGLDEKQKKLRSLADDKSLVPVYWTKHTNDTMRRTQKKKHKKFSVELVDAEPNLQQAVITAVEKTWNSELVGKGNDARSLSHTNIKIKKVQRVENPAIWQDYNNKRRQLATAVACSNKVIPDIKGLQNEDELATRELKLKELDDLVIEEINEALLFHGTKNQILKAITMQGLDSRLGKSAGMFGQGVYFAEKSTKADQYADARDQRTGGEHHMILARVLLGNTYVCGKPDKMQRPPCTTCSKPECLDHGDFYDSVIGIKRDNGSRLLFREFIVYEKGMCYPEFVITYERC